MRIGDHLAWVAAFAEESSDEFVETKPLWPRHFDDAVDRRFYGDAANRTRYIFGRHGLDQNGCDWHRVVLRHIVGDPLDELEELRSVDERVLDKYTYVVYEKSERKGPSCGARTTNTLSDLRPVEGKSVITLQTCTLPDFENRLLVRGELKDVSEG